MSAALDRFGDEVSRLRRKNESLTKKLRDAEDEHEERLQAQEDENHRLQQRLAQFECIVDEGLTVNVVDETGRKAALTDPSQEEILKFFSMAAALTSTMNTIQEQVLEAVTPEQLVQYVRQTVQTSRKASPNAEPGLQASREEVTRLRKSMESTALMTADALEQVIVPQVTEIRNEVEALLTSCVQVNENFFDDRKTSMEKIQDFDVIAGIDSLENQLMHKELQNETSSNVFTIIDHLKQSTEDCAEVRTSYADRLTAIGVHRMNVLKNKERLGRERTMWCLGNMPALVVEMASQNAGFNPMLTAVDVSINISRWNRRLPVELSPPAEAPDSKNDWAGQ